MNKLHNKQDSSEEDFAKGLSRVRKWQEENDTFHDEHHISTVANIQQILVIILR